MSKTKGLLAAVAAAAMAFTFSCSSSDEPNEGGVSSSGGGDPSSSSVGESSSSEGVSSSSGGGSSSSSLPASSSSQAIVLQHGDPITDARDGKTYETVVIGKQTWMAKNLDFEADGSKCYNNSNLNCTLYGRLYDWETAMNAACPAGWHLPSNLEWAVLEDFIGGGSWSRLRANGTDGYGFSALPGGYGYSDVSFDDGGSKGYFWSSTEDRTNYAYYRDSEGSGYSSGRSKSNMYSLRCVKGDNSPTPSSSSYTPVNCTSSEGFCDDRDGKSYKSVDIDGKTWMAENLNFDAEGSLCYEEDPANCVKYGKLYDWQTAMAFFEPACNKIDCFFWMTENHKGICPSGWHVPSREEFQALVTSAGGSSTAGQILKATSGWGNPSGNGTDLLGFSALPSGNGFGSPTISGGYIYGWNSGRINLWSSTTYDRTDAYLLSITGNGNSASISNSGKSYFLSLRCVRDD